MRFDDTQQHQFDLLIGQAGLAHQEKHFDQALEHLQSAGAMLSLLGITDEYDWSGYYDLRMCIERDRGDHGAAATTARQMLNAIDPAPEGFSPRQQEIIQDSLVEAALLRARHLLKTPTPEAVSELRPLIDSGIHWCERLGRDGDQRDFETLLAALRGSESHTA